MLLTRQEEGSIPPKGAHPQMR